MNPVLILARNGIEQTKRAIISVQAQDVPTRILLIDNDSADDVLVWAQNQQNLDAVSFRPQIGVSAGWNWGLKYFFGRGESHVLVLNNDVELPPWFYRGLLETHLPFVTGVSVDSRDYVLKAELPLQAQIVPHPDFSAFLITEAVYNAIGPFDESMMYYASDCDYHIRAHRLGIPLLNASLPFYHERSSTLRNASPEERAEIEAQANADRAVFFLMYGCLPGEPKYAELFK